MTENKLEIIKLILENGNAEQAVRTFAEIIAFVSKQHEANQQQAVAGRELMYQTSQGML